MMEGFSGGIIMTRGDTAEKAKQGTEKKV